MKKEDAGHPLKTAMQKFSATSYKSVKVQCFQKEKMFHNMYIFFRWFFINIVKINSLKK